MVLPSYYPASSAWEIKPSAPSTPSQIRTVAPSAFPSPYSVGDGGSQWVPYNAPIRPSAAPVAYKPGAVVKAPAKAAPKAIDASLGLRTSADLPAVGSQKKVSTADGGYALISRLDANNYQVSEYRKDGSLISAERRSISGASIQEEAAPSGRSSASPPDTPLSRPPTATEKAEKVAAVLQEVYPEKKFVVKQVAAEPKVSALGILEELNQGIEERLYNPVVSAIDYVTGADSTPSSPPAPVSVPSSVAAPDPSAPVTPAPYRPVAPVFPEEREPTLTAEQLRENAEAVERGEAPPNREDLNDPFANLVIGTGSNEVFNIDVGGGQIYPVTDAEKKQAAQEYLDKKHPTGKGAGGDNELVAKYFWFMVPQMSQNGVNYDDVASIAKEYERLIAGDAGLFNELGTDATGTINLPPEKNHIGKLDPYHAHRVIAGFNKDAMEKGIPAPVLALFNAGIVEAYESKTGSYDIRNWMTSGEMGRQIQSDGYWVYSNGLTDWLSSPQGLAAVGAGVGVLATAGAFAIGGPVAGIAASGTLPFSTTEFIQTFGEAAWKTKGELQLSGEYSQDHVFSYNQLYGAASDSVSAVGFSKSKSDPTLNLQNIDKAEAAIHELEITLRDKWQYLEAAGVYDDKIRQLEMLKGTLEANKGMFAPTGEITKDELPPVALNVFNVPEGVEVFYGGKEFKGDHGKVMETTQEITSVISVKLPDGSSLQLDKVTLKPYSEGAMYDVGEAIQKQLSYKGKEAEIKPIKTVTLNLQPGQVATIGTTVLEGGSQGKKWDVVVPPGAPTEFIISGEGKKSDKVALYYGDGQWEQYTPMLEDAFKIAPTIREQAGFNFVTTPGTKIEINGKVVQPDPATGILTLPANRYSIKITKEGYDSVTSVINLKDGELINLADPTKEAFKPYQKSGGGGGGGGSGGGGGGGSAAVTWGLIKYGDTCRGAKVWQDEVQIEPEIGKEYSIDPGYHSIRVEREGKKTWLKTVYCAAGDVLTVSPAFEDVEPTDTPTTTTDGEDEPGTGQTEPEAIKRVFVNSNPSGAKVLLQGGSTGEWTPCYLDLPYGYYTIGILKSGYKATEKLVYVGDVIAWGTQATYLAQLAGWI